MNWKTVWSFGLHQAAEWRARVRTWYLLRVYLPTVRSAQDLGQINNRLYLASPRETRLIVQAMGAQIAPDTIIMPPLLVHNARPDYGHLRLASGSYLGPDCLVDLSAPITLGQNAVVAMRVSLITHYDGGQSWPGQIYPASTGAIHIEPSAYVGAGAIILPNVTIGVGALVAAGAVVTARVAPYTLVGGVPARFIKALPHAPVSPPAPTT